MINFKKIYNDFIIGKKFLKLVNFFHFEKINPQELIINPGDKCLLLSPHFDDETLGCGGLLIKYPQNIHIVCLTNSKYGTNQDNNEELINIRKKEFSDVMKELNITSYEFLDIEDGKLVFNFEKFRMIDVSVYDYIFIPNYFDNHKDHKAVSILLKELLKKKKHKNSLKIVFYEVWAALTLPNYYIDISNLVKRKRDLIKMYISQNRNLWFFKGIIALNSYRGMLVNKGSVEMYTVIDKNTFMKL